MAITALQPAIIAIDGPAASGKSTVGHLLAHRLGFLFFDTGIMYRAVTWAALAQGVDVRAEEAVGDLAERIHIDIRAPEPAEKDGRQSTVAVDGRDVTWLIRAPEIDRNVSVVASHGRVRAALTAQQRRIGLRYGAGDADRPGIVMVGRDVGTVVVPDAPLKIFMEASAEERARRRLRDLQAPGKSISFDEVLAEIRRRDRLDSERALAPLRAAADAVVVDTSEMTIEQVVEWVLREVAGDA
jgi:cytidylate kinase